MKPRSRRRRVTFRITRVVVIGAIATVLSCWASAVLSVAMPSLGRIELYGPQAKDDQAKCEWASRTGPCFRDLVIDLHGHSQSPNVPSRPLPAWVPREKRLRSILHNPDNLPSVGVYAYGWPILAMYSVENHFAGPDDPFVSGGLWLDNGREFACYVPLQIAPVRFATSVLVWGGGFELLVLGACFIRKRCIQSRNGCSRCGYPLRGLPPTTAVCPECGMPIPVNTATEQSPPRSGEGVSPWVEVARGDRNPWKGAQ